MVTKSTHNVIKIRPVTSTEDNSQDSNRGDNFFWFRYTWPIARPTKVNNSISIKKEKKEAAAKITILRSNDNK